MHYLPLWEILAIRNQNDTSLILSINRLPDWDVAGGLDYHIATIVSFSLEWLWLFGYSSPIKKKNTPIIENIEYSSKATLFDTLLMHACIQSFIH